MGPGFDSSNPFMAGLMALYASQNPQVGPALDAAGLPPPAGLGGPSPNVGAMINPAQPSLMPSAVAAAANPQQPPAVVPPFQTTVQPEVQPTAGAVAGEAPAAGAGGQLSPAQMLQLASLGGVKAPQPIQPIMHGGVTGGVKAPEVNTAQIGNGSQAAQLLQAALLSGGGANPLRVPELGSLIRGGRYG